ncbi:MAG: MFS transporter [Nocardioides sp.]|uniref:MFS transporter n=1 Tax=Nocardioides sp. TaxID=35761 RepID=UPI0039E377D3
MTAEMTLSEQDDARLEPRRMHPVALTAALTAVMVPVMSFFSVNVALGEIGQDLSASAGMLQLVVAAYGVVYASLVVIGGRLGDSYGRKRALVAGLTLFALTSLLCSVAQTPGELVGARVLQGVAAAFAMPQVLATIHASTDGEHRSRAIAWFGATAGIATSLAFLVGGLLTDSPVGWRAIFWVNAPVTAIVLIGIVRYLPETKAPHRTDIDLTGAGLLGATMTLLILPLTEGRALGWPTWTWICLAAVLPVGGAFVAWQDRLGRHGGLPLIPLPLFRFRSIGVGLLIAAPFFVAFGGFMFIYSLVAQAAGMSPLRIGVSLLPMSLAFLGASLVAGRLVPRYGASVLSVGSLIAVLGYAAVGWTVAHTDGAFTLGDQVAPMVVAGLGLGLVMPPLMGIVLGGVDGHLAGLGSGLIITTQQAGLGLGSAVVGSLYLSQADPDGFAGTAYLLAAVMLVIAALTRLLEPRRR